MTRPLLRPLWNLGVAWLVTCLIGAWLPVQWMWAAAGLAVLGLLVLLWIPPVRPVWILTLAAVALAAVSLAVCVTVRYQPVAEAAGQTVALRAKVQGTGEIIELQVLSGDLPAGTRLRLWGEASSAALATGDVLEADFTVQPITATGLSLQQQKASGVWGAVLPAGSLNRAVVGKVSPTVMQILTDWRENIAARIQGLLADDSGAVVTGICLGADEALSDAAVGAFRTCGVSHLFAVSGLHLSLITQALLWLMRLWRVPRRIGGVVCMAATVLFAALVGWTPSIVRAGVMCLLVTAGTCLRRQADARNSMGLALLLLLVPEPMAVYDAGLLLSFLATFGVLFVSPLLKQALCRLPLRGGAATVWNKAASVMAVTLSATLATLPVTVLYFGTVSLVGVLANLLMTTVASLLLIIGWLAIVLLAVGLVVLYRPLLLVAGCLSRLLLWLAHRLAAWPVSAVSVRTPHMTVWIVGSVLLVGAGYGLLRRRGVQLAAVVAAIALCVGTLPYQYAFGNTVRVGVLDVSGGLAVCLRYRSETVLVLAPEESGMLSELAEALRQEGIRSVQAVFTIGGDRATASRLPAVLEAYVSPGRVYGDFSLPVSLWPNACAVWQDEALVVQLSDCRLAFDTGSGTVPAQADCVIGAERVTVGAQSVEAFADERPWVYITGRTIQLQ